MWGEVAMPSASRDKYAMCQLVTVVLQTHDFGVGRTWPRFFLSRGPCDKVAYMTAMTVRGKKKKIERQPREMWNVMRRRRTLFACVCLLNTCVEVSQCCANSRYRQCNVVQYFGDVSPAEKNDWEKLCNAPFPCNA